MKVLRYGPILGIAAVLAVTLVAATGGGEPERVLLRSDGYQIDPKQFTLPMMVESHDVVIGTVVSVEDVTVRNLDEPGFPPHDPDPRYPAYDPETQPPSASVFWVEVTETVKGGPQPGDVIPVVQSGGYWKGTRYEGEYDPLMEVGERYLLFLWRNTEYYTSFSPARFTTEGDKLNPVAGNWSEYPVFNALNGLSIAAAKAQIGAPRP